MMSLLLTGFEWLAEIGINMWLSGVGRWEFSDKHDPD